jgi:filamentous hemagglutinin family protein
MTASGRPPPARAFTRLTLGVLMASAASPAVANQGLVARDGSLGRADAPLEVGAGLDLLHQPADYLITADLGEQRGANLFHSFARFGIGAGETATFTEQGAPDPGAIAHVISRVTGGTASQIDGTLRSTMPGADVWLINPSGLVFGAGARLDLSGSFHAATADSLTFDDAGLVRFHADPLRPSVLAIAEPRAFGFLGARGAAPVSLEPGASLTVGAGNRLELAAGNLSLRDAEIVAAGAHVRLEAQEGIELRRSSVDVSGTAPGSVSIVGGQLVLEGGPVAGEARSLVLAENSGTGSGGTLSVDARESVDVENGLLSVNTSAAGDAGTLTIKSPVVRFVRGPGIDPEVPQATLVGASAETTALGAAGSIRIDAGELILRNGVSVSATAAGWPLGELTGRAGVVEIAAHQVEISERSYIASASWGSVGGGGAIRIDLGREGSLLVDANQTPGVSDPSRYAWVIAKNTGGDGGLIEIRGGSIRLVRGGHIQTACNAPCPTDAGSIQIVGATSLVLESGGGIHAGTVGEADGGDIHIEADSVSVSDGGYIGAQATAGSSGDGGEIRIEADSVDVRNAGSIVASAAAGSSGDSGSISIEAGSLRVSNRGTISTTTWGSGSAGDIAVRARESIVLDGEGRDVLDVRNLDPSRMTGVFSASALGGGLAGAVTLEAPEITVASGAIASSATVYGGGSGGDISLRGDRIAVLQGGIVSASSIPLGAVRDSGSAGRVTLTASRSIEIAGHHALDPAQRSAVSSNVVERIAGQSGTGGARAGLVTLAAPSLRIDGGQVLASAPDSDGGEISILARDRVHLVGGEISASVGGGTGGNIAIDPTFVILEDGSRIVANAGAGTGGNIRISAQNLFLFPGSTIDASSELGIDGVVDIRAPDADLAGSLTALPARFIDASSLLRERCAARRSGERAGSFTVRGAAGVPADPDAPLAAVGLASLARGLADATPRLARAGPSLFPAESATLCN